jgi:hypothetical protein
MTVIQESVHQLGSVVELMWRFAMPAFFLFSVLLMGRNCARKEE